jgi:endoglucanase
MAMAGRIYAPFDRAFAKDCRKRAIAAWKWASTNPGVKEPQESGGTGAYGDDVLNDEFFWAAAELLRTTGKAEFRKYVERHAAANIVKGAAMWSSVNNCGVFSLVADSSTNDFRFIEQLRQSIITEAVRLAAVIDAHPVRIPSERFIWGSNDVMLNNAIILCYAYRLTHKRVYLECVNDVADYIFGKNATGYSFVTGFGAITPLHPHHRIMGSDGIVEPFPGFLVGGPNAGREDENRSEPGVYYPYKEPARSYVDQSEAYASNEVAINWNAALVFVLGFLSESVM